MRNLEISKFNKKSLRSRKRLFVAMQKEDGVTVKSSPTQGRYAPVCFVFKNETAYIQHLYYGEEDYFAWHADRASLILEFELAWHKIGIESEEYDFWQISAYWDAAKEVRRRKEESDNAYSNPTTQEVFDARMERGHTIAQAASSIGTSEKRWQRFETVKRSMPSVLFRLYKYGCISPWRSISKDADNNVD